MQDVHTDEKETVVGADKDLGVFEKAGKANTVSKTVKKALLTALIVSAVFAMPISAFAAPFLVCSPETITLGTGQTLTYNVSGLPSGFSAANIPADSTGTYAFALDLATLATGSYTVTATACLNDSVWGQICSAASSPFSLTKPSAPAAPINMGLSTKQ